MAAVTRGDIQLAAVAAGFTLGFGFLTVWEAIKQTRRNRNPIRSLYIWMIWGEILANIAIGVLAWIWLNGTIQETTVTLLFFVLLFWVFEIQFLLQIIINRIAVIAENQRHIRYLRWGTATVITMINIAVFCIFIPAHLDPPVSQTYVDVNKIWDRISKILICLVDGALNVYFSRAVKNRLVRRHGLVKYARVASHTDRLMVISVLMDVMLIGLMSLPNQIVFTQFHPVAYLVKLNIEMAMASLITKVARATGIGDDGNKPPNESSGTRSRHDVMRTLHDENDNIAMKSFHTAAAAGPDEFDQQDRDQRNVSSKGIQRRVDIRVESASTSEADIDAEKGSPFGDDEMSLARHAGHPRRDEHN